jgi:hypothetical protein
MGIHAKATELVQIVIENTAAAHGNPLPLLDETAIAGLEDDRRSLR